MSVSAEDVMTRSVITTTPKAPVARLLSDHHISAVPVCDPLGRLVGMISEGDAAAPARAMAMLV